MWEMLLVDQGIILVLIGNLSLTLCFAVETILTVDRDFASNVSIKFRTPEEFFLDASPKQVIRQFDPTAYIDVDPDAPGKYLLHDPRSLYVISRPSDSSYSHICLL